MEQERRDFTACGLALPAARHWGVLPAVIGFAALFGSCPACPQVQLVKPCGDDGVVHGGIDITDDRASMGGHRFGSIGESGLDKCRRIEGSLWIGGNITDLSALNQIEVVTEDVVIIDARSTNNAFACFLPALTQTQTIGIIRGVDGTRVGTLGCVDRLTAARSVYLYYGVARLTGFNHLKTVTSLYLGRLGLESFQAFQALETADTIEIHDSGTDPMTFPTLKSVRSMTVENVHSAFAVPALETADVLYFASMGRAGFLDIGSVAALESFRIVGAAIDNRYMFTVLDRTS